jgi:hypothetical protein
MNLRKPDKLPHYELIDHPEFIRKTTGIDPYENHFEAMVELYRILDIDVVVYLPNKLQDQRKLKVMDHGHTHHTEWGVLPSVWLEPPFGHLAAREILDFDPWREDLISVTEWANLPSPTRDLDEIAQEFAERYEKCQSAVRGSSVYLGGYYLTLFMWPRMLFDFESFIIAAAQEPRAFGELLERFAEVSRKYVEAWSRTDVEFIYIHDDIALTQGPVFAPSWYDDFVFPRYQEIWEPLKKEGKKIVFTSDGNLDALIDGLVEAGVDGFQIEPVTNMEAIAQKYGDSHFLMGNISTVVLTNKDEEAIEREIRRCLRQAGGCPGFFLSCSQTIPHNVPLENLEAYFRLCERYDHEREAVG